MFARPFNYVSFPSNFSVRTQVSRKGINDNSLQECNDPTVLGNILAIQRELLSARSLWRPSALSTFLDLEATEVIARLLVRVCKPSTPLTPTSTPSNAITSQASLSDHSFVCSFWILSALATKGKNLLRKHQLNDF